MTNDRHASEGPDAVAPGPSRASKMVAAARSARRRIWPAPIALVDQVLAEQRQTKAILDRIHVELQFANLGPERVIRFVHRDKPVRMWLPYAQKDWIQNHILRDRDFFEHRLLEGIYPHLRGRGVFVDAGANIGNHSLYFALACGARRVIAFEPQVEVLEILRRNVTLNGLEETIEVEPVALGRARGSADFERYRTNNFGATSLSATSDDGPISVAALDDYDIPQLDVLKIDVEGASMDVLEGARNTIARTRPITIIEVRRDQDDADGPNRFFADLRYTVERLDAGNCLCLP